MASKGLNTALWMTQSLLALTFVGGGVWKLLTPIPKLAAAMPWMGQVEPSFLYMTAVFDVLGGVGVLLPSLTRVKPVLAVVSAHGCMALMICAAIFHWRRGEPFGFNLFCLALSAFVAWGRGKKRAPIAARDAAAEDKSH